MLVNVLRKIEIKNPFDLKSFRGLNEDSLELND